MNAQSQIIVAAIQANNNIILDTHNDKPRTLTCVGEYVIGMDDQGQAITRVVCLLEGKAFCLNPIELDRDGKPYLSQWSVGGNVDARNMEIEEAVQVHNDMADNHIIPSFRKFKITEVIMLEAVAA